MYKIIGADGKEYGPITADQLRRWVAEGRVNALTQVQAEGGAGWQPLTAFPEFADALHQAPPPPPPVTPAADTEAFAAAVAARDYRIDIGGCIGRGWVLLKSHLGTLIGGTVLIMLTQMVIAILPMVGGLGQMIVGGALTGGLYWLFIRAIRGESTGVGDAFAGFSRGFVQLMLGQIVKGLLAGLILIPGVVLLVVAIIAQAHSHRHGVSSAPSAMLLAVGIISLVVAVPVAVYLSTCWYFTLPLIIDKGMDFWPAMKLSRQVVRRHWWNVFGLVFVSGLVAILGIFACGIGLLFTIPIGIGATMCAYEDIFGAAPPAS